MKTSAWCLLLVGGVALAAPVAAPPAKPAAPPPADEIDLHETARQLFDAFAPEEIKAQYDFPSRGQWDEFAARLQQALDAEDLGALAAYEPEARAALAALQLFPDYADQAEWLEERLDYIEAAKEAVRQPPPVVPPPKPGLAPAPPPYYDLWLGRLQARPAPARAAALFPVVSRAFAAEGVPPQLAWIAEVESTFNPAARSPVGAKGLFQLMPATAKELGLSTFMPDERTDPEKSARAAARYLRAMHDQFGDWPLALAAYNAGPGRVRRLLAARQATTFAGISASLSAETRMYVPKVLAAVRVRSGLAPDRLPAPSARRT
jgi:membrane-bound lytic murein transglycosylase D